MTIRYLYLHGFASGPGSTKGRAFADRFAQQGITLERLDLRVPSFEHLRLSAMLEFTRAAIGGEHDRAVVMGSSLGGLTAAWLAARDPRVLALVLLAPAFRLIERWPQVLPPGGFEAWRRTGWREVLDYTTGQPARVDFGFCEDAAAIDVGDPDVRVPTLILHGVHDEIVPIAHSRRFAASRAHVELIELDDGHELIASLPRLLDEATRFTAEVATRR